MSRLARKIARRASNTPSEPVQAVQAPVTLPPTKIYLDDQRELPAWAVKEGGWVLARNVAEYYNREREIGFDNLEAISFDNDLGIGYDEGYKLFDTVEEDIRQGMYPRLKRILVHTQDRARGKYMKQLRQNLIEEGFLQHYPDMPLHSPLRPIY